MENENRLWEIFSSKLRKSVIIEGCSFDNALREARKIDESFNGGRVYDEKVGYYYEEM